METAETFERFRSEHSTPDEFAGALVWARRDDLDEWSPTFGGDPYEIVPFAVMLSHYCEVMVVMTGRAVEVVPDGEDRDPRVLNVDVLTYIVDGCYAVGTTIGEGSTFEVFDGDSSTGDDVDRGIGGAMVDALSTAVDEFARFRSTVVEMWGRRES